MSDNVKIDICVLPHGEGLTLPAYATEGAAGADFRAAIATDIILAPMARTLVPTGIMLALPPDYEAQIRPRSGLAAKHGISVLNTPGTIDSDYRGEIQVILINLGAENFTITRGERIAQMVVAFVAHAKFRQISELTETARNGSGFGSTGKS